jgi:hypothetical protein
VDGDLVPGRVIFDGVGASYGGIRDDQTVQTPLQGYGGDVHPVSRAQIWGHFH